MMAIIILLALVVFVGLLLISIYNRLVRLRTMVQEAWSSIDVMLKKRHDLIPNLVETVKAYATHEKQTLDSVIAARNSALQAKTLQEKESAEKNLQQAMMNLHAVAEQYPDLKANSNFQQLQTELSSIEGDIEKSRRYYNGSVREYNILTETFPSSLIANQFKFEKSEFFEIPNEAEREVPQVKF